MKTLRTAILIVCCLLSLKVQAQSGTRYTVSFPNLVHHEAQITVVFTGIQQQLLEARMARSSPGRYALHEFAKNVYAVKAENSKGQELPVSRPNPYQWNVTGHDGTVKITYTLFGDHADGTYAGIDETHAHLNAPATFLYARGFEYKPSVVEFMLPAGRNWTVATQLKPESGTTFSAPNLQYLMDSPVEMADLMWQEWPVTENGKTRTMRFALHHQGTKAEFENYVAETKKIVDQGRAIFGELPDFDFGTYTFIGCYGPQAHRDGMEHRNSTILTSPKPLKIAAAENLGTVSHEFFHAWNVERIRPLNLEPFNFEEANMSDALWFAEGFTSYYGDLMLCRSGALSQQDYLRNLGQTLNYFRIQPGKDRYSPVEMSRQAAFVDASRSVDNVNRLNTYVSYYTYGEVLGMALDLTIRARFPGLSLDDLMRATWTKYGKTEKPYQLADLERTLAEVTRDEVFASEFFQKYVYGHVPLDFKALLLPAGLELRPVNPKTASLGYAPLAFEQNKATLQTGTMLGSPLYLAGIENGDALLKLGNKSLRTAKDLETALKTQKPGDTLPLVYERYGQTQKTKVTLIADPAVEIVSPENKQKFEQVNMKQFRDNWLGTRTTP